MKRIIKAKSKDFEVFYKLFKKSLESGSYLYPAEKTSYILTLWLPKKAKLKKDVLKGKKPLYVAYEDDKITGYLLTDKTDAGVAFGHWLGVEKTQRRKGIGSKLLTTWEKEATDEDAHSIFLWSTENNVEFYKKRGFSLGGKFPKAWFGLDHYFFYKNLK